LQCDVHGTRIELSACLSLSTHQHLIEAPCPLGPQKSVTA
jgi:hypothetical protein